MSGHTPGPWCYEPGGGHAPNRIVGSESVQVHGWPEPRGGVSNASYSDCVCENLGDTNLPGPAANVRLIVAALEMRDLWVEMTERSLTIDEVEAIRERAAVLLAKIDGADHD